MQASKQPKVDLSKVKLINDNKCKISLQPNYFGNVIISMHRNTLSDS